MTEPVDMQSFDAKGPIVGDELPLVAVENVQMAVSVQLGRVTMTVGELLRMGRGSVVMLDRKVGEPVEILVNGKAVARGELTGDSLVWTAGMASWTPARQVPEVAALFPPPAPPV